MAELSDWLKTKYKIDFDTDKLFVSDISSFVSLSICEAFVSNTRGDKHCSKRVYVYIAVPGC